MVNTIPTEFEGATTGRFALVVSQYNDSITGKLREGALEMLLQHRVPDENITIVCVPGAWEIPLAARKLASSGTYSAVICLGAVIRGETTHDQHINAFVSQAIGQMSLEFEIPIAFGVLTCNSFQQAQDRAGGKAGNKGHEAALAALQMVGLLKHLD